MAPEPACRGRGSQRRSLGCGPDLLRKPRLARDQVLEDPHHAAVGGVGNIARRHGSLLREALPFAELRGRAHLAGAVGEGGDVEPVRLHQVAAQPGRDPAVPVEVMDKPGVIDHETPLALVPPDGGGPPGAEDVVPVGGAVHHMVAEAVFPLGGEPEAQARPGVERYLAEGAVRRLKAEVRARTGTSARCRPRSRRPKDPVDQITGIGHGVS